ncbi:hypothetical protein MWU52_12120 [Jannaschia sp. S6380]|uniref:hypothetical protein n=1 Tax=Jannaschia sp. S6380 TaxID=2926408 RepID=UPI001FF48E22|nr:hypothetical protein [Jannaschia sp. S6380]MCK0168302.1 hypothetical protein [Jannaschia sp. S6380]
MIRFFRWMRSGDGPRMNDVRRCFMPLPSVNRSRARTLRKNTAWTECANPAPFTQAPARRREGMGRDADDE